MSDNVTPFPQAANDNAPPHLFENPSVAQAMDTLMEWSAWRVKSGQEPPWTYYRLYQLRDAIIQLGGDRYGTQVNLP